MSAITSAVIPIDVSGAGEHVLMPAIADKGHIVWRALLTVYNTDGETHEMRIQENGVTTTALYIPNGSNIILDAGNVSWIRTPINTRLSLYFTSANTHVKGSIRAESVAL